MPQPVLVWQFIQEAVGLQNLCFDREMSFCCLRYTENLVQIQKKLKEMVHFPCTDL